MVAAAVLAAASVLHVGPGQQYAQIRDAVAAARPGDTILVADGTYKGFDVDHKSRITIRATGRRAVVVPTTDRGDNRDTIFVTYSSDVTIDGLRSFRANRAAVRIDHGSHVTIEHGVFGDNRVFGIFTDFSNDLHLIGNEAYGSKEQHGIYVSNTSDRPVVRGNVVHDNAANGLHFNGDASEGGRGTIVGALIEDNVIYRNGRLGGGGINMDGVQGSVIRGNVLWGNHAGGITSYRIDASQGPKNDLIDGNTIDMAADGRYCVLIGQAAGPVTVRDNILFNRNPAHGAFDFKEPQDPGLTRSDWNVIGGATAIATNDTANRITLAAWKRLGHDRHSFTATAAQLWVGPPDYHLHPGSPALGRGFRGARIGALGLRP